MAVAQGTKPAKKASAPKKAKTGPSHPPYIEMVKEALVSLKERTGSSTYAIAKHIEEQQKVRDLPPNFRKVLAVQIKKFVASGKLVKVKNSFKLPPTTTTAKKSSPATTTDLKPKPKSKETAPKKTTTITSKPKPKSKETASKKKTTTTSKPKSKETASKKKTTATSKPKAAAVAKKVAKSPVKKLAAKKVVAAKAKKPKSVKSPMKNAPAAKKVKK